MNTILIVEKSGSIKEVQVKNVSEDELYKKAGYKTNEGFKCHTTWSIELDNKNYTISLYGKTTGRANQENKYEFPPPVDKLLFFGNCVLVHQLGSSSKSSPQFSNIKKKEWEEIYEKLYGGFEDIGDEDSEDDFDDEDDEIDETKLTKSGYLKDDFIVDEEEEEEDEEEEEEEEEEDDDENNDDDDIPKIKTSTKELIPLVLKKDEDELY